MALQFYSPSRTYTAFDDAFNRTFWRAAPETSAASANQWRPAIDIRETDNAYLIEAEVPGVDPNSIDITLDKGVLTLKGERLARADDEAGEVRRNERVFGVFERRFTLPDTADVDTIEARAAHGVLSLTIAKKGDSQPRRIEVKLAD